MTNDKTETTPDQAASPMASGTPDRLWERLTSSEAYSIRVPEHSDGNRLEATRRLAEDVIGGYPENYPNAIAWLASKAEPWTFRAHIKSKPWEVGCMCEDDEGWSCPDGDGPPSPVYSFAMSDVVQCEDMSDLEVSR